MITLTSKISVRAWAKAITYQWTKVSGPGTVTFGSPTLAATTAAFGLEGTYVLRCTATDGVFVAEDETTVLAVPPSAPPLSVLQTLAVSAQETVPLSVQLTASNNPTSWLAVNLPSWLTLSPTGLLTGTRPLGDLNVYRDNLVITNAGGVNPQIIRIDFVAAPVVVTPIHNDGSSNNPNPGGQLDWQVALSANPGGPVTLTLTFPGALGTPSQTVFNFNASNWSFAQGVTCGPIAGFASGVYNVGWVLTGAAAGSGNLPYFVNGVILGG